MAEQDYQHYDGLVQQLRGEVRLKDMDACVNTLTDSLYNIANTLTPQNRTEVPHTAATSDPLMVLADQVHAKWRRGECESEERNAVRDEAINHLKSSAVSKERNAWTSVLQENDSKAVWEKINWKGTFDKDSVSNKPALPDLANHFMQKGQSVEDSTLLSDVTGNTYVPDLDDEISLDEIDKASCRLKEKSSGDGWAKGMITNLPLCVLYALQIIYNAILSQHSYPSRWRTTLVNEIFKNKGKTEDSKN